jgi:hypothetical protein
MNKQLLKHYIHEYKVNFDWVNQKEIYKWRAVKCFQDNWNIDAENFHEMLVASIRQTQNLLKSGQYFPLRMLTYYSEFQPEEVRNLFKKLYDEDQDLYTKIENFQKGINSLNDAIFPGKKSYQDHRAIVVYLTLHSPKRYFFYKFKMFKIFSEKLEHIYRPVQGHIENIGHFNRLCELLRHELSQDQDLLKLHKNRIAPDCYYDENLNILTQDFIYSVVRHLDEVVADPNKFQEPNSVSFELANSLSIASEAIHFKGRIVNFIQNGIENKHLGDLGELWVMNYEIEKLKKANKHNLIKHIKHISIDEGDGTGYDIESFDLEGKKIFIEVKTTKGSQNSSLFISRNELERSKIENEQYYLYRLFNYNEELNTADLLIIQGDLSSLCEYPVSYKINLKENN